MHSDPEDRLYHQEKTRLPALHIMLLAIGIVGIAAAIYLPNRQSEPSIEDGPSSIEPVPSVIEPPTAIIAMPDAPDIPVAEPEVAPASEEAPVRVQVDLATSDQELREALTPVGTATFISQVLEADDLILRSAGLIDSFSHGLTPRKVLPLPPPQEKFSTLTINGQAHMNPASFQRYDSYAKAISAVNIDTLVTAFHRFRPLIETAYAEFGYSGEELDNALIRSLDYVLATPEPAAPIALERKEAVFLFSDPELEQLPPLQKQLLRTGPENMAMIKRWAETLRRTLLAGSTET